MVVKLVAKTQKNAETLLKKKSLTIGFLNVNGYSETTAKDVEDAVALKDVNIMCLAETKKRLEDRDKIKMDG